MTLGEGWIAFKDGAKEAVHLYFLPMRSPYFWIVVVIATIIATIVY
jgi:hypothetical protein